MFLFVFHINKFIVIQAKSQMESFEKPHTIIMELCDEKTQWLFLINFLINDCHDTQKKFMILSHLKNLRESLRYFHNNDACTFFAGTRKLSSHHIFLCFFYRAR